MTLPDYPLEVRCPSCGAAAGKRCRTTFEGEEIQFWEPCESRARGTDDLEVTR